MKKIGALLNTPAAGWVALLLFAAAAYGVLIPWLGYYGDDWSYAWLAYRSHQLPVFFAGNRPLLGEYFVFLTRFLGPAPWHWALLQLAARWISAAAFWRLLLKIWPAEKALAAAAAALMVVFPGFELNSEGMNFNPFFFQLALLMGSLLATLRGVESWRRQAGWTALALAGAFLYLLVSEYFYFLELARLALIWLCLRRRPAPVEETNRPAQAGVWPGMAAALLRWLPYGALWAAFVVLRLLGIGNVAGSYQPVFINELRAAPLEALARLAERILRDLWTVTFASFGRALTLPGLTSHSLPVIAAILAGLAVFAAAAALWLTLLSNGQRRAAPALPALAAGLLALLLAGGSIWAADLRLVSHDVNASRFSMPFIPGACLLVAALVRLVPYPRLRSAAWAVLAATSTGFQLLVGFNFIQQKQLQQDFLTQLSLRIPAVQPGTLFLMNHKSLPYNSENSNSALLNWLYTPNPVGKNLNVYVLQKEGRIRKALTRPAEYAQETESHMIGDFSMRTLVSIYYHSPNCLRVLDPELDLTNPALNLFQRRLAGRTDFDGLRGAPASQPPPAPPREVFGAPARLGDWCADFARAGLAAQRGDWARVVEIGERGLAGKNPAHNPLELAVYIEAYARQGQWQRAGELLDAAARMDPDYTRSLCRLKDRLAGLPSGGEAQQQALAGLACQ